jgi:hypothetical protein
MKAVLDGFSINTRGDHGEFLVMLFFTVALIRLLVLRTSMAYLPDRESLTSPPGPNGFETPRFAGTPHRFSLPIDIVGVYTSKSTSSIIAI